MAQINTNRPEAAAYNGRKVRVLRPVTSGPSFDPAVSQIVVEIDGNEVQFFGNEVILDDDERESVERAADEAEEAQKKQKGLAEKNAKGKKEWAKSTHADAGDKKHADEEKAKKEGNAGSGSPQSSGAQQQADADKPRPDDERTRFNRLPSDPPPANAPQGANPPMSQNPAPQPTVTQPGLHPVERPLPSGAQPGALPPSTEQPQNPPRSAAKPK